MARGIPELVAAKLREVVGRPDFAYLDWDPDAREWIVGLYAGRREDGKLLRAHLIRGRLGEALDAAQAVPVPPPEQAALVLRGGAGGEAHGR